MLSYNSCPCFGPAVIINKYRVAGSVTGRKQSNAFVCCPCKYNSTMVKCYGSYGYKHYDNYSVDYYDEDLDFDSDGYCSENDLLPDLDNLKSENTKSVGKTSDPLSLRAVKAPSCPKRELKHVNGKTNVLPMHERTLSGTVTSQADSSILKPMSLSQKEREKRAINNIQQQKLIRIAIEKMKSKQKIMFESSMPSDVKTFAESISMEKKRAVINKHDHLPVLGNLNSEDTKSVGRTSDPRSLKAFKATSCSKRELKHAKEKTNVLPMHETSLPTSLSQEKKEKRAIKNILQNKLISIAMKKKKSKQKTLFKSSVPKDVKTLAESILMEKKKGEQSIMLKSSKLEDFGTLIGRIPVGKKKAKQNTLLKSVKSKHVDPLLKSIAMEKKKLNQKVLLKSSNAKYVDPLPKSIAMKKKTEQKILRISNVKPLTESTAMKKKKTKQKNMLKSSKAGDVGLLTERPKCVKPIIESIAMKKKKPEQKNMLKSSKAGDIGLLTGRSTLTHSRSAIMDLEIKAADFEQIKAADFEQIKPAKFEDIRRYNITKQLEYDMAKQLGYEARCGPLIQYLKSMGFKESHLVRIYDRRKSALHKEVEAVQRRLDFLISVGVKSEDLVKIITRHPQILEYSVDSKIKSHIEFLQSLGVPASRLGRILTAAPSLLSYNVERSLKPKVRFLTEEVGIKRKNLGKIVVLSPQILIHSVEGSMKRRLDFLSKELGASKATLVKMVTKHPQLLRYNIKDGIKPRINFLRSIGMSDADILKVLTRLTQILSLSVEKSLRPKYLYLVKELKNGVQSLVANPAYLSLSLEQRIWARHKFLILLNKEPSGPFPLTALLVADDSFCSQWAHSTLEEYEAFRKELILSNLKKKLLEKYGSRL